MAVTATQPTSYLSDPNATAGYQKAMSGAADLYSQYDDNPPIYDTNAATAWANVVPGLLAPQTPYQVNAAQSMGNLQGYMTPYTNAALGYATSSAVPINNQAVCQSQIHQYMSPYLNNVVNSAVQNINETNAQQQQQMAAQQAQQVHQQKLAHGGQVHGQKLSHAQQNHQQRLSQAEMAAQQTQILAEQLKQKNLQLQAQLDQAEHAYKMEELSMKSQVLKAQAEKARADLAKPKETPNANV